MGLALEIIKKYEMQKEYNQDLADELTRFMRFNARMPKELKIVKYK